ncbi:cell division protein YceG [Rouxiella silvae]|uniref:Endolytic murein transglycosylase n=1 Tax=Rouxiella silvae TaxID=1646373 RepID=A0AA40WZG7_9GAMM|nr:endolytic transglycosylase MltG [Rouxiella silvae]MBF6635800.1 endolytic transglycosylase MltG [Rouxiella silvae]ORJ20181.1 cell division protein YceG [Rouxiella silvae]
MKNKKTKILAIIVIIMLAVVIAGYVKVEHFADRKLNIAQEKIFTLPAGTGRVGLEDLLVQQKLIGSRLWFGWLLRVEPPLSEFKAGTYRFPAGMTVRQMLELLRSGKEAQFSIRFVEGFRLQDWMKVLQNADYLKHDLSGKNDDEIATALGMKDAKNAEGWLYPDTYSYTAGTTDLSLLKRSHLRMEKTVAQIWKDRDTSLPYKTPTDMLTMASIIEKETAIKDERKEVASVFINRLRIGMRLQTDPTVIYGMGDSYKGVITKKDLETATPYNTYIIDGLPPSPIAMPSEASIDAAAHPAKSDYLYFVADGKGGHTFTTNLESHNKAVRVYRDLMKNKNEK